MFFVKVLVAVQYQVNPEKCGKPVTSWKSRKNRLKATSSILSARKCPARRFDDLFLRGRYFGSCPGFIAKSHGRLRLYNQAQPDYRHYARCQVAEAMNSINAGQAQQEAAEHEAEAAKIKLVWRQRQQVKPKARNCRARARQTSARQYRARHAESVQLLRECGVSGKGSERNPVGHPVF